MFRCEIRGENFPPISGTGRLTGFFTTRWVEAGSADDAEQLALEMLREEFVFSEELKAKAPDSRVYFDSIVEVQPENQTVPNRGAVWFDMETD